MLLLDEMVSFRKLLSMKKNAFLEDTQWMSVKHLYIARDVMRRFGILEFSENLHNIILRTIVMNYMIFTLRGGQVV